MTAKGPTQQAIRRAIQAAQREGLHVLAIRPDGSVVVGKHPVQIADVLPIAPRKPDDEPDWHDLRAKEDE